MADCDSRLLVASMEVFLAGGGEGGGGSCGGPGEPGTESCIGESGSGT